MGRVGCEARLRGAFANTSGRERSGAWRLNAFASTHWLGKCKGLMTRAPTQATGAAVEGLVETLTLAHTAWLAIEQDGVTRG